MPLPPSILEMECSQQRDTLQGQMNIVLLKKKSYDFSLFHPQQMRWFQPQSQQNPAHWERCRATITKFDVVGGRERSVWDTDEVPKGPEGSGLTHSSPSPSPMACLFVYFHKLFVSALRFDGLFFFVTKSVEFLRRKKIFDAAIWFKTYCLQPNRSDVPEVPKVSLYFVSSRLVTRTL